MAMIDYLGWTATGVFVGSYFCRTPRATRQAQMLGALLWLTYGLVIGALPVVAANALVFAAAAWTAARPRPESTFTAPADQQAGRAGVPGRRIRIPLTGFRSPG
jgi:hypothetical protein